MIKKTIKCSCGNIIEYEIEEAKSQSKEVFVFGLEIHIRCPKCRTSWNQKIFNPHKNGE
jgi:hypothetical protein